MEKVWFISDNHFGHKNILNFCPNTRLAENVDEMDQKMIQAWQAQVKPEDHVFTLGDVFFCKADRAKSIMSQLPGHKHLIWGNHDKVISENADLQNMFETVDSYKEFTHKTVKLVLFHFPIYEWNRMHHGSYHLFGHVHGSQKIPGRALDVGVDGELSTGAFNLYSWEQIHDHLKNKEIRTHHDKKFN